MIVSFSCENFYSFKERTDIDLRVRRDAPETNAYVLTPTGERASRIFAVLGHNASGKTNLLKALGFIQWFVTSSFKESEPAEPIPLKAFDSKKPIYLEVSFVIEEMEYRYTLELTQDHVNLERLEKRDKTKSKITYKRIFERKRTHNGAYALSKGRGFTFSKKYEQALRPNASLVATGAYLEHKALKSIWTSFMLMTANVGEVGKYEMQGSFQRNMLMPAFDFFDKFPSFKEKASKHISLFDLGLTGFEIVKTKDEKGKPVFEVYGVHRTREGERKIGFHYESAGTQRLLALLHHILITLESGSVAIIDEFDTDLHPSMANYLVELFLSPKRNSKGAQLIFSSHSPEVLKILDKYQVALVEKNEYGESSAWRLDSIKDIRSDENYYAKYIAGAYGGVPHF